MKVFKLTISHQICCQIAFHQNVIRFEDEKQVKKIIKKFRKNYNKDMS